MPLRSSRRRLTPASGQVLRDRGTGRSLTPHPGRVRGPVPDQGLLLVGPGDRVELMDPAVPVVLRRLDLLLVDLGERVERGPMDRELPDLMDRVHRGDLASRAVLMGMGPVDPAAPVDRVGLMSRAAPVGLADRADLELPADPADLELPADPVDRAGRADLVGPDLTGRAAQVDRHRRPTSNTVSTTGVARSGVAPGTHRMDSARRITVRRLRRRNTASGGTTDLRPAVRRLTGTAHRLLAVGTGRHLLAAGTVDGTGRRAT
jgi:hypothetical protein